MNGAIPFSDIAAALGAEHEILRGCVELLTAEQDALIQGELDALPQIVARKTALLSDAEERTAVREALLAQYDVSATRTGMQQLIGGNHDLNAQWNAVLHWAKKARDMNRVNGCLIDARLGANGLALAVLHGAGETNAVYGRDGHLRHQAAGRALAVG